MSQIDNLKIPFTKVEMYVIEEAMADLANASKNPKHWELHGKITSQSNKRCKRLGEYTLWKSKSESSFRRHCQ